MQKLELTEDRDIELFILARKYEDQINKLAKHGMFDPFKGSKTVHKDGNDIKMVETNLFFRF